MNVNPAVDPAVIAGAVMSTVLGVQTGAGLFITSVAAALAVTTTGLISKHPAVVVPLIKYVPVVALVGVAYTIVAAASVKYVNVNPVVEPAVIAGAVKSIVPQVGAGLVITTIGAGVMLTVTGCIAKHPAPKVPLIKYVPEVAAVGVGYGIVAAASVK